MLRQLLADSGKVQESESLDQALLSALSMAHPGDTVLFSPACASFDMFRNFEERGRIFKALIQDIQQQAIDQGSG